MTFSMFCIVEDISDQNPYKVQYDAEHIFCMILMCTKTRFNVSVNIYYYLQYISNWYINMQYMQYKFPLQLIHIFPYSCHVPGKPNIICHRIVYMISMALMSRLPFQYLRSGLRDISISAESLWTFARMKR